MGKPLTNCSSSVDLELLQKQAKKRIVSIQKRAGHLKHSEAAVGTEYHCSKETSKQEKKKKKVQYLAVRGTNPTNLESCTPKPVLQNRKDTKPHCQVKTEVFRQLTVSCRESDDQWWTGWYKKRYIIQVRSSNLQDETDCEGEWNETMATSASLLAVLTCVWRKCSDNTLSYTEPSMQFLLILNMNKHRCYIHVFVCIYAYGNEWFFSHTSRRRFLSPWR